MSYLSHVSFRSHRCPSPRWVKRALPLAFVILSFGLRQSALAHPADQSEMRVRPSPHKLEIRLTFNILTLTRFTGIDTDGDHKISMAELSAAQPRIATYLNQHIQVEINQKKASLGSGVRFEPLWPDAAQTPPMTEIEYAARNVDVTFVQTIEGKVLEDFWLGFEIFEQTGPMQTIHAIFEQDGRNEDVSFSAQEPEYLYDTGYADDPFIQEAEKKNIKAPGITPPAEDTPTRPAATLATVSPYAAPTARTSAATVAAPPAGNPDIKLATPADAPAPATPAPRTDERWWMVRAAVLMILLVVGRKLQLTSRAQRASTRRHPRSR